MRNVRRWHTAFGVAMAILVGTTALYYSRPIAPRELTRSLFALPLHFDGWTGEPVDKQASPFRFAQVDSEVVRIYRNASGDSFGLYIAHLRSQDDNKKLVDFQSHDLAYKAEPIAVPLAGTSSPPRINRTLLTKNGRRWLAYYWFEINGRIVSSRYMAKVYMLQDALWERRTDGALVLVFRDPETPGQGASPSSHEMALLRSVVATVHAHLSNRSEAVPASASETSMALPAT